MSRLRHPRDRSRGQTIVELALILPIMLLLLATAADLGRMFHTRIVIANAARAGALEAGRHPTSYQAGAAVRREHQPGPVRDRRRVRQLAPDRDAVRRVRLVRPEPVHGVAGERHQRTRRGAVHAPDAVPRDRSSAGARPSTSRPPRPPRSRSSRSSRPRRRDRPRRRRRPPRPRRRPPPRRRPRPARDARPDPDARRRRRRPTPICFPPTADFSFTPGVRQEEEDRLRVHRPVDDHGPVSADLVVELR